MKILKNYNEAVRKEDVFRMVSSHARHMLYKEYMDTPFKINGALKFADESENEILALLLENGEIVSGNSSVIRRSFDEIFESFGEETFDLVLIIRAKKSKNDRNFLYIELA